MSNINEWLVTLGLDPRKSYTNEEIKNVYRNLAKSAHPDGGGDEAKFRKINNAYKMLTDPSYRAKAIKNNLNLNINFQVPVDFEDAFFGRKITVSFNKFEIDGNNNLVLNEKQNLEVFIFDYIAGEMSGFSKVIVGGGLKHKDNYGDAIITFVIKHHNRYQLDNAGNIITQENIDLETMLKGGKIVVQTLFGLKTLRIPPGTRPGDTLAIKNCGVLQRANHLVRLTPVYPTKEELKSNKKFKGMPINWQEFQEDLEEKSSSAPGVYLGVDDLYKSSKKVDGDL